MSTAPARTVKPGFTTTEWWSHILTLLMSAGIAVAGVIHPGYTVPDLVPQLAGPAAGILAAVSTTVYAWSRTRVKTAALELPVPPVLAVRNGSSLTASPIGTASNPGVFASSNFVPGNVIGPPTNHFPSDVPAEASAEVQVAPADVPHPNTDAQEVAHPGAQNTAAAPPQ